MFSRFENRNEECHNHECRISPPRRRVERIRDKTPEPLYKRCVRRLPTPPGDLIERIRVIPKPKLIIERIYEQPRKPAPRIIERIEHEPAPPPIIRNTCVFVDPTPRPGSHCSTESPRSSNFNDFNFAKHKHSDHWLYKN